MIQFEEQDIIYENPLAQSSDVSDWIMEGQGTVSFPKGKMRQESLLPREAGQKGNIVHWCPEVFPDDISISWDFQPFTEPGLAILFFSAMGCQGEDIHSDTLAKRTGPYCQYNNSDINALHISYFRRNPGENEFQTCNLRKSKGFHLVAQGADPLPAAGLVKMPYRINLIKSGPVVSFNMGYRDENLNLFTWEDDGSTYGSVLGKGKIGFRQMTPLIAEYANLVIKRVVRS